MGEVAKAAASSPAYERAPAAESSKKLMANPGGLALLALAYSAIFWRLYSRSVLGPRDPGVAKRFEKRKKAKRSEKQRKEGGEAEEPTGFGRVAGVDSALRELEDVVLALKNPERLRAVGARCPRGVLLSGPSGTGKTLLAAAVAGEAGVPFLSASGSAFVEVLVGRGAARVRELFARARRTAPCIVFIDEVDAIAKTRDRFGHNDEREQTLNQLLCELDGFDNKDEGEDASPVVLIAATNRPECLDAAIVRPGRLDKIVNVPLPDARGRLDILRLHAKRIALADDVDLPAISDLCHNYSGADIANVANEAALLAIRDEASAVSHRHLIAAVNKRNQARIFVCPQR